MTDATAEQVFHLRSAIVEKDAAMDALAAEVDRLRLLIGTMEAAILANATHPPVVSKRKKESLDRWAFYHEHKAEAAALLAETEGDKKQSWRAIKRVTDKEWRALHGSRCADDEK